MPPRKSNVSIVSSAVDDRGESTPVRANKEPKADGLSVEDISLPKSMVARLSKGVLPPNTQIHKDALLALHKSATVFVSYIASNSNENASAAGKKTIAPHDVIAALKDAEFEAFIPRLEAELTKYSSTQNNKRNTYRKKVKEEKAAAATTDGGDDPEGAHEPDNDDDAVMVAIEVRNDHPDDDAERPFKKFKAENGETVDPDAPDNDDPSDDGQSSDEHEDDDVEDDDGEDDDPNDVEDELVEDDSIAAGRDDLEAQTGLRDEALDASDSD